MLFPEFGCTVACVAEGICTGLVLTFRGMNDARRIKAVYEITARSAPASREKRCSRRAGGAVAAIAFFLERLALSQRDGARYKTLHMYTCILPPCLGCMTGFPSVSETFLALPRSALLLYTGPPPSPPSLPPFCFSSPIIATSPTHPTSFPLLDFLFFHPEGIAEERIRTGVARLSTLSDSNRVQVLPMCCPLKLPPSYTVVMRLEGGVSPCALPIFRQVCAGCFALSRVILILILRQAVYLFLYTVYLFLFTVISWMFSFDISVNCCS